MGRFGIGLVCAAALSLCAVPAYAQEEGPIVDPDSPSGKEYEIPFESARRQADPRPVSPNNSSSGGSQATLFGEGVTPPSAAQGSGKGGGSATSGAEGDSAGKSNGSGGNPQPDIVKIAASRPGAPDSGLGTPALFLGIALVVLLVGAGAGFIVRRRAG